MKTLAQLTHELVGITLTPNQLSCFDRYEQELLEWNAKFNLTAIRDSEGIRLKHFLDSLTCLTVMHGPEPTSLIDIGTGAGFPGIPLKILLPSIRLTLVESIGKKADFCKHVVEILGMKDVEVLTIRAEEVGQLSKHREKYDWAVARAVAAMPILMEYLLPLVRVGGAVLAQKGGTGPAEALSAEKAASLLGGHLRIIEPVTLPGVMDQRYMVVYEKHSATPSAYPRRVGAAIKKPLG